MATLVGLTSEGSYWIRHPIKQDCRIIGVQENHRQEMLLETRAFPLWFMGSKWYENTQCAVNRNRYHRQRKELLFENTGVECRSLRSATIIESGFSALVTPWVIQMNLEVLESGHHL